MLFLCFQIQIEQNFNNWELNSRQKLTLPHYHSSNNDFAYNDNTSSQAIRLKSFLFTFLLLQVKSFIEKSVISKYHYM